MTVVVSSSPGASLLAALFDRLRSSGLCGFRARIELFGGDCADHVSDDFAFGVDEECFRDSCHAPPARGCVGGVADLREVKLELADEFAGVFADVLHVEADESTPWSPHRRPERARTGASS